MQTVFFSITAAIIWGFNDFFIQRSTRSLGTILTFFVLSLVAVVVLLPFVDFGAVYRLDYRDLAFIILVPGIFSAVATFLEFQAFKIGPISIIDNLITLEIPFSILIAAFFGEELNQTTYLIIFINCIGLLLLSDNIFHLFDPRHLFSNYLVLGLTAAVFFAFTSITVGWGASGVGVVETMFFLNLVGLIFSSIGLVVVAKTRNQTLKETLAHLSISVLAIAIFDLLAWCAYSYAASGGQVSIAIVLSQGYTVITTALGVFVNHEQLNWHQKIGVLVIITTSFALATQSL